MYIRAPHFWWKKRSIFRFLFAPISWLYGYFAHRQMLKQPLVIDLPVLCIGNFTLGGAGKTPVVIAFAKVAKELGFMPGIVSRGYGGMIKREHLVDEKRDNAHDVGDEALLLARHAHVVISPDRYAAAHYLKEQGCDLILMDDGFQSRRLYADYALLVVDAMRGLGNNAIFPAGPLRAPLKTQFSLTDSILLIGDSDQKNGVVDFIAHSGKSLHYARLQSLVSDDVSGKSFLAFAGIGNPDKFFQSIKEMSGNVVQTCSYPDHYVFTNTDIQNLAKRAKMQNLWLATTAKDYIRMQADDLQKKLKNLIIFDVEVNFAQKDFCRTLLEEVIERFKKRKHSL
ncbi:tetraacyldisaccharide 4'-kinase [Bartonella sp. F02]|uniref:tetraacyldisaccharide 4'-kinase n=1 Tax=Bartonella sp. F02 TaxID=2967262 RepID=UPI0022A93702|nr:tetraacyldisaccharide 4'-kinase [Bartonella sp. F02]MCZ2328108.1 tetraacyldisaccharide 4'-kinase [Bartonella sp. F02]